MSIQHEEVKPGLNRSVDYLVASTTNEREGYRWYSEFIVNPGRLHYRKTGAVAVEDYSYKGFHGHRFLGTRVASNSSHWLLWASGGDANWCYGDVVPKADKIARIDLQHTVSYETENPGLIEEYYSNLKANNSYNRKLTYINNNKGGTTLYIGSMTSAQFGRVYYKDAELGLDSVGKVVRYEVCFRDQVGTSLAKDLVMHLPSNRGSIITGTIQKWFNDRNLKLVLESKLPHIEIKTQKWISSDDRKITWLRTQVGPAIHRLIDRGFLPEVQDALQLELMPEISTPPSNGQSPR